jgi:hypothetical protein
MGCAVVWGGVRAYVVECCLWVCWWLLALMVEAATCQRGTVYITEHGQGGADTSGLLGREASERIIGDRRKSRLDQRGWTSRCGYRDESTTDTAKATIGCGYYLASWPRL